MQRLRLKADGRIVILRDGREMPLVPVLDPAAASIVSATPGSTEPPRRRPVRRDRVPVSPAASEVRDLRARAGLTQAEFAAKLDVPLETIRNWEQGKRRPRGPARALLVVLAHAPDTVFAALAGEAPDA